MKSILQSAKRSIVPLGALAVTAGAIALAARSPWWLLILAVSLPLVILGVRDFFQRDFVLLRNYPGAAHIRRLAGSTLMVMSIFCFSSIR